MIVKYFKRMVKPGLHISWDSMSELTQNHFLLKCMLRISRQKCRIFAFCDEKWHILMFREKKGIFWFLHFLPNSLFSPIRDCKIYQVVHSTTVQPSLEQQAPLFCHLENRSQFENLSFLADCSSNKLVGNFFVLAILSSDERENVKNLKLKTACKGQAERKCLKSWPISNPNQWKYNCIVDNHQSHFLIMSSSSRHATVTVKTSIIIFSRMEWRKDPSLASHFSSSPYLPASSSSPSSLLIL